MHKGFAISVALVLLLSSGTFAAIDQAQQFNINTSNIGTLTGAGTGALSSINLVPIANIQEVSDGSGHIQFVQVGVGSLVQGASATGLLGIHGYNQGASTVGNQWQTTLNYLTLGLQDQSLGTAFTQDVLSIGGLGSAVALQNFIGSQNQFIITPFGVSANIQVLGVGLLDGVGGPTAGVINNGLSINRVVPIRSY